MKKRRLCVLVSAAVLALAALAWAVPGYHINDMATARQAVQQYGENNFQFGAVVYQAYLDKNLWRLAIAAHDSLGQKPGDPMRECSFAQAYWRSQRLAAREQVPPDRQRQLAAWYDEAVRDTEDATRKMPRSADAHLVYGEYLQYFVMGMGKVPQMQAEYKKAVALTPQVGEVHQRLADAYFSSGPLTPPQIMTMISEYKRSVALDPRQTESYFFISASYYRLKDWKNVQHYLNKYLQLHPEATSRPDTIAVRKILAQKLGKQN